MNSSEKTDTAQNIFTIRKHEIVQDILSVQRVPYLFSKICSCDIGFEINRRGS